MTDKGVRYRLKQGQPRWTPTMIFVCLASWGLIYLVAALGGNFWLILALAATAGFLCDPIAARVDRHLDRRTSRRPVNEDHPDWGAR